jgi:hypothetical protein
MQPATHKKIVFGAIGCSGALGVLMVASMLMVRHTGVAPPPAELPLSPVTAAAALDSLSTYDLPGLFAPPDAPFVLVPSSDRMIARWRSENRRFAIQFLDTAPPDSWQARSWREAGAAVIIESLPAGAPFPDSEPIGRAILAAARVQLESGDPARARDAVALALQRARHFEGRPDVLMVVAGLHLERDALEMLARDSLLAGDATARALAKASLMAMDRRLGEVRSVRALIAAAGVSAAAVPTLAAWARDSSMPLAIRDEMIRAIGFGWVLDPPEVTYGLDTARVASIRSLAAVGWPPALAQTLREATLGRPNMVSRLRISISYRTKRMLDL